MKQTIKNSSELLKEFTYRTNRELLLKIVNHYNIVLEFWPFSIEILGIYWLAPNKKYTIAVNSRHSYEKQNFIIAIQLGHHFLNHGNYIYLDKHDTNSTNEREVNNFAVSLLIPENEIAGLIKEYSIDELALKFELEPSLINWRIKSLGLAL